MENKTVRPSFCGVCGSRLQEDTQVSTSGFDVYTGERISQTNITLHCPNPTVTVEEFRFRKAVTQIAHPSYALREGVWAVQ